MVNLCGLKIVLWAYLLSYLQFIGKSWNPKSKSQISLYFQFLCAKLPEAAGVPNLGGIPPRGNKRVAGGGGMVACPDSAIHFT